jgi:hypothetical protein
MLIQMMKQLGVDIPWLITCSAFVNHLKLEKRRFRVLGK